MICALPVPGRSVDPSRGRWLMRMLAMLIALAANALIVVGLAHLSHLPRWHAQAPLPTHRLRQLPVPAPPPPPPVSPPPLHPTVATPAAAAAAGVPLPSLDLPPLPPTTLTIPLPSSALAPAPLSPLQLPAFIASSASGGAPATLALTGDAPAERDGAFDLERFYPRAARLRVITGSTRVRISISARGEVEQVQVLESTPHGVFEEAALRLAHSLHFHPALSSGVAVASVQDTLIRWTIQ